MNNLTIVKSQNFGGVRCDIYADDNKEMFVTINQLAEALEYASKDSIASIISRNQYLRNAEFSVTRKLQATDGKAYNTTLFTEDGIYEVAMLSSQPKAQGFRAWIRKVLKEMRNGELKSNTNDELKAKRLEIMMLNAKQREANLYLKLAGDPQTEKIYSQILKSKAVEVVSGEKLLPYPIVQKREYTATEIAQMLGMSSANAVGSLSNKIGLKAEEGKTNEFGRWTHTKSKYSTREVKSWVYFDEGVQALKEAMIAI